MSDYGRERQRGRMGRDEHRRRDRRERDEEDRGMRRFEQRDQLRLMGYGDPDDDRRGRHYLDEERWARGPDRDERPRRYDARSEGLHRGKGPKGYTRSDERIREDVCDELTDDPDLDAGEIEVKVSQGEVTLSGYVDERWAKRHAEDLADRVRGVEEVHNHIRLARSGESRAAGNGKRMRARA